jgi:hypothetical protein
LQSCTAEQLLAQCQKIPLDNAKGTTRHRKQRIQYSGEALDIVQFHKHPCRYGIAFGQICGRYRACHKRKDSTYNGSFYHQVAILVVGMSNICPDCAIQEAKNMLTHVIFSASRVQKSQTGPQASPMLA